MVECEDKTMTDMTDSTLNRRQFLKITGCGAFVAAVGTGCAAKAAEAACPYDMVNDPYPGQCHRYTDLNGSGFCDYSEVNASSEVTTAATAAPTIAATSTAAPTATPDATENEPAATQSVPTATESIPTATQNVPTATASSSDSVLCNNGCSYPGRCGRYLDTNGTGRCDLSEFTASQAQAAGGQLAAAALSSGRGPGGRH
jgi:hypothetical protein